ncbi:putative RNA helicase [Tulasnella sp. 418]|nr:putative RNA helicase [Tulasnella sp. 418]
MVRHKAIKQARKESTTPSTSSNRTKAGTNPSSIDGSGTAGSRASVNKRRHNHRYEHPLTKRRKLDDDFTQDINEDTSDSEESNASSIRSSLDDTDDEDQQRSGGNLLTEDPDRVTDEDSDDDKDIVVEGQGEHDPHEWRGRSSPATTTTRLAFKSMSTLSTPTSLQPIPDSSKSNSQADFSSLGISAQLVASLHAMSIRVPTPVQAACIPPLLAGRDCIGNAKTGQGKTVAFAIPILQALGRDPYGIFALVLTPTRELAFQIADQFAVLGAPINARTSVVVGGMDMMAQSIELNSRPHVVVATPGRLVDLLKSCSSTANGEWNLGRVKFLVLDEADRLLSSTFANELKVIFGKVPKERQTCLFTATLNPAIDALAAAPPRPGKAKPFVHRDASGVETVETLTQQYILCPSHVREVYLYYLLCNPPDSVAHLRRDPPMIGSDVKGKARTVAKKQKAKDQDASTGEDAVLQPPPTIIFVRKPKTAAYLTHLLQTLDLRCTALHSGLTQPQRLASLNLFRAAVVPILICTDVGARGLDIDRVALVINWDLPTEVIDGEGKNGGAEEYVHRVGRTARMGRGGVAISFVTERDGDEEMVKEIETRIS